MNLPAGLTAHTLTPADVDGVVAMINDCERHDTGEPMWERADLLADSSVETFDRDHDWLGVFDAQRCAGWAMVQYRRRAFVDVHPSERGRGVGTVLRRWTEARAREIGAASVAQVIDDRRTDVVGTLRGAGYRSQYSSWILRMDHPIPPVAVPPSGIELRAYRPADETELLEMFEDAFSEFEARQSATIETWKVLTTRREGFRDEDMIVALEDGEIVGGAFLIESEESIWVDKFAVRRDHRRRGIARAMLDAAFARSAALGSGFTELNTDSRTGALPFYERIGMSVRRSFTNWTLEL